MNCVDMHPLPITKKKKKPVVVNKPLITYKSALALCFHGNPFGYFFILFFIMFVNNFFTISVTCTHITWRSIVSNFLCGRIVLSVHQWISTYNNTDGNLCVYTAGLGGVGDLQKKNTLIISYTFKYILTGGFFFYYHHTLLFFFLITKRTTIISTVSIHV